MSDHRKDPRVQENADVMIHIESAPGIPELEGKLYPAKTIDLSLRGLRLLVDSPVPAGTRLELKVIVGQQPSGFSHAGIVKWDHMVLDEKEENQFHTIGIQLETNAGEIFDSWRETVFSLYKGHDAD